ncbi:anhydro-N-acetylmuramic acid kinase [Streptomyces sp. TRM43335]|uniref:Anhydro-N-acetylmuramic acid kinase n=1 Tax=Streptomyces taklimakanensis TaxID=2569853 RepID=A0A6G2B6Z4_9ACTN|nr:anhydro-N-acetylmuramic acid kinase [Streptomyces taklimakanensis]MTE17994.1 anhydro-N-acetylmuramic acid kinase [Streptomyces taklimakanensis]
MRVIGLMSGTSCDAIDAAAADLAIEGDTVVLTPLGALDHPFPEGLRRELSAALPPASTSMADVCRLDTLLGQALAAAAERADRQLCEGRADLVVSHGHTLYHWTEGGRVLGTLQLGQPAWIAERTGRTVVSDLRPRDVAAGGQGAPLVSALDVMWLRDRPGAPVALNLGGIANITAVAEGREPSAYDTGPANVLLDTAVRELTGGRADRDTDGALAAAGTVHGPLLERLLAEPYYALPPPRTTGRELFDAAYLRAASEGFGRLSAEDLLATLTELTARTVADAVRAEGGTEVIASGGGTRNPTLMAALGRALGGVPVRVSDELGLPSDAKEAYAFALLGFLTVHGLPGTVPSCTGARRSVVLGSITPGREPLRPVPPVRATGGDAGAGAVTAPDRLRVAGTGPSRRSRTRTREPR